MVITGFDAAHRGVSFLVGAKAGTNYVVAADDVACKLDSAFSAEAGNEGKRVPVIHVVPEDLLILLTETFHLVKNRTDITTFHFEAVKALGARKAGWQRLNKFMKQSKVLVLNLRNAPHLVRSDSGGRCNNRVLQLADEQPR
jgi:hypothetical protein